MDPFTTAPPGSTRPGATTSLLAIVTACTVPSTVIAADRAGALPSTSSKRSAASSSASSTSVTAKLLSALHTSEPGAPLRMKSLAENVILSETAT